MQKLLKDRHPQIFSHDISNWSISWHVWLFKPAQLPIVGEKSLGACDRLTQSVFRRFEKKSYKTLTLMSSAFSPCLTATKVSIADGPFESKLSSQALILTLTRGGEVHKWTED